MRAFFRRTKILSNFKVQSQLGLVFIFWSLSLIIVLAGLFFINYSNVSEGTNEMIIHDGLLTRSLLIEQASQLAIWYGAVVILFVVLMSVHVMIYAHRLTGPIFKLNKILDESIEKQEWPKAFGFRKADAFHDLAEKFTIFCETMKNKK